jgi:internalin A
MERQELLDLIDRAASEQYRKLDLAGLELTELPPEIGKLVNLEKLILAKWFEEKGLVGNRLTTLPIEINQLQHLIHLYLSHNQILKIPTEIGQLYNLTELYLSHNQILEIPVEIGQLQNLTKLYLGSNKIKEIPAEIGQLQNLTELYLGNNKIKEIPTEIGQLQNLKILDLSHNQITVLPPWLGACQNLQYLSLQGNPVPIPSEILETWRNARSILSFYFQSQTPDAAAPLYEAKFIIVGEGEAGKTTLARKLQNPDCKLPTTDDRTDGIDITRWEFIQPNGQPFRVNIWDFGGQEIYHATHQFFLTERSLHTLVIDNRRENPNFYYWLNVVRLLSKDSPIFITQNEKANTQCEIDEGALRKEFHNLQNSIRTNFATNRGLAELQNTIQQQIANLPHLHLPIPNTYITIRAVLENYAQNQNYIKDDQYFRLCRINGITDETEMLSISRFLHDLGICLHFQTDPILKHWVILQPTWATNAVYQIANYTVNNTRVVAAQQGRFNNQDLQAIWSSDIYRNMHDELLQLMQQFGICYPIRNLNRTYIAPSLLPTNQPSYTWDDSDNLILRYEYEFMPRGLITRFIVESHDLIEAPNHPNNQLVWKNGVVLCDHHARAEIIEDYNKREIRIRVTGSQRQSLLATIRREFKKIHTPLKQLRYTELIPYNCPKCDRTQEPYAYPFNELQEFLAAKAWQIQCRKSRTMVDVRGLLQEFSIAPAEIDKYLLDQQIPRPSIKHMKTKQVLRIVVASPGDVQTERDILADRVIPELNKGIAKDRDIILELDRWEESHPGFHLNGPQGLIDEILQIPDCDIFICLFWKRFGTSLKIGDIDRTGTEHEFDDAIKAWRAKGTPKIMMYFKEQAFLPTESDLDQYNKILSFKKNFPIEGLYWKFQDEQDFERQIRQHLTQVLSKLVAMLN